MIPFVFSFQFDDDCDGNIGRDYLRQREKDVCQFISILRIWFMVSGCVFSHSLLSLSDSQLFDTRWAIIQFCYHNQCLWALPDYVR